MRNDPELTLQYEKLSKQYDAENKQKILEEMEEVYEYNHNIRNQSQHHEYQYCYYKIVHYDKDLYEKQKSEYQKGLRKSKPDGRVECRIFIYEIYMHWIRTRDKLENTVFKFPFCAIVAYMCEDHGRRSLPAA